MISVKTGFEPIFLRDSEAKEYIKKEYVKFVDAHSRQVKELFFIENKKYIGVPKEKAFSTEDFKKYAEKKNANYKFVYFGWNNHLVKIIGPEEYIKLKTNRNQDMITADEQKRLYNKKVAVFGMSVGSNIAFVLTQAGISQEITIADFDELDTTNLNRILSGVHQVGQNKCILSARKIYEDNPYAKVNIMPDGITTTKLNSLLKNNQLDLIIEEIDDIKMKIETRKLAIKYKVPVVMVTDNGDGIILHIERYDLGYDKILHTPVSFWDEIEKQIKDDIPKELAGKIIIEKIVGGVEKVDPKMLESAQKVMRKELVSWSQLGSAAVLGGVYATFAVKKILLREDNQKEVRVFINPTLKTE